MVAELVLLLRPRVLCDDIVFHVNKWSVLQPLALNLFISLQPGIDLMAHLGGGVTGGLVMLSGVLARDPQGRLWRLAARVAGTLMAACIAMALSRGRPWELRRPVLELESLPGTPVAVPIPRGLSPRTEDGSVVFGDLPGDPLVVQCTVTRLGPGQAAPPPAHRRKTYRGGALYDVWTLAGAGHELQLEILRLPDLPESWASLPEQIRGGVVFRDAADATAPGPSSPGLPAAPAAQGPPPSR
jgi:hypothetical protein